MSSLASTLPLELARLAGKEGLLATWTLEKAKNQLSEVVRRAPSHEPQVVTRGRHDAVVVIAREDYERLVAPVHLAEFMRASPLAEALKSGDLRADAFERRRDMGRDIDL
jgi:prevent-host-death family protein